MVCCRTAEKLKPVVFKQARPKLATLDGKVLDLYWVPKEHYEAFFKEWDKEDTRPNGVAFRNTNEVIIREGFVPMAYRIDINEVWDHQHYYERLWAMPGGGDPKVRDRAVELHLHECGHAIMGWAHDEGSPVMDGTEDGSRVKLGKRLPQSVDRDVLFKGFVEAYPNIRMIRWEPGMTKAEVKGDDPY